MTLKASDLLLRWASEVGEASWGRLRDAAAGVIQSHDLRGVKPWMMANDLSVLGHIDVDWEQERWSVSPPVLALSPGMGLCGYLCGWRTNALMERFEDASDKKTLFPFEVEQRRGVTAWFVKAASISDLKNFTERLGAQLVSDPALQLAQAVVFRRATDLATPVPPDGEVQQFDPEKMLWFDVRSRGSDGLYRFEMHGQKRFRLRRDGEWYGTDRSAGMTEVLQGRPVLTWCGGSRKPRSVFIPTSVTLPILAERALVASSGLIPQLENNEIVYRNVSKKVARAITDGLGFDLKVVQR